MTGNEQDMSPGSIRLRGGREADCRWVAVSGDCEDDWAWDTHEMRWLSIVVIVLEAKRHKC